AGLDIRMRQLRAVHVTEPGGDQLTLRLGGGPADQVGDRIAGTRDLGRWEDHVDGEDVADEKRHDERPRDPRELPPEIARPSLAGGAASRLPAPYGFTEHRHQRPRLNRTANAPSTPCSCGSTRSMPAGSMTGASTAARSTRNASCLFRNAST